MNDGKTIVGTLEISDVRVGISMLEREAEEEPIGLFSSVVMIEEIGEEVVAW